MTRWLTTRDACDLLAFRGKHQLRSLYRVIARYGIPTARTSSRRLLVDRVALQQATGAR